MKNRIKEIRKDLKMTQQSFADRLCVSKSTIEAVEYGRREVTIRMINDICREFNVNEEWLRTGNGEKYIAMTENQKLLAYINKIAGQEDSPIKRILLKYAELTPENRKIVDDAIEMLMNDKE